MTTLTKAPALETGTWQLDPVHSRVGFAVGYLAGTFHGSFAPFEATLAVDETGRRRSPARRRSTASRCRTRTSARTWRRPSSSTPSSRPRSRSRPTAFEADGAFVAVPGELTIKGITKPVQLTGSISGPIVDPYGRQRVNVRLETTVDRSAFGLDWNVPLPSGEPALAQDVSLDAELGFIKD